jgi:molecular chaperone Hsp33
VFTPHGLRFGCRCSRERVETMLRRFPEHELDDMRDDDGDVVVTCQFCNIDFRFDDAQLARLHGKVH